MSDFIIDKIGVLLIISLKNFRNYWQKSNMLITIKKGNDRDGQEILPTIQRKVSS